LLSIAFASMMVMKINTQNNPIRMFTKQRIMLVIKNRSSLSDVFMRFFVKLYNYGFLYDPMTNLEIKPQR